MEAYIGTVMLFGGTFVPRGWLPCDGRLLPISQYDVMYTLLGTTYGGDGVSTFGLPDLRGRMAIGTGQGPSLPNYPLGQQLGVNTTTLTTSQMPAHTHPASLSAVPAIGTESAPSGKVILAGTYEAKNKLAVNSYAPSQGAANVPLAPKSLVLSNVGGSLPIDISQPYLGLQYMICMEGLFPPQP